MTRPNKKAIAELLDEFARLETRRIGIELKRDRELKPHREAYEKRTAPIVSAANARLESIDKRMALLAADINAQLLAGVDEKTGTIAVASVAVTVETTKSIAEAVAARVKSDSIATSETGSPVLRAIAQVDAKNGNREIDPQDLFTAVPEAERTSVFWSCLKVLMGEVDKYLGKVKADALAKPKKVYSVSISVKP